jgi:hypothetical protein
MRLYTDLLEKEAQKENFRFFDFITQLPSDALRDFTEDVLSEQTKYLREAFPPSKNISTIDIVFHEMRELPYATYQTIRHILEQIFSRALDGNYPDNQTVIDNIVALTSLRKDGLSISYIMTLLEDSSVCDDVKATLAILLSLIDKSFCCSYLDTGIGDHQKYPYLVPAYISAYKEEEPDKALKILAGVAHRPEYYEYCESPIITALENLLIEKKDFQTYLSLYGDENKNMPAWVEDEFNSILSNTWFTKNHVKEEIAKHRSEFYERMILEDIKTRINKRKAVSKYQNPLCKQYHTPIRA